MHVLFVCTGNTCRSPMAEHLLRRMAMDQGLESVAVRSAGVAPGSALTEGARAALADAGIADVHHRPSPLTREAVDWADMIFTMEESHGRAVLRLHPEAAPKTRTIRPGGISDPYGGSPDDYRKTLEQIRESLFEVIKHLKR